MKTLLISITVCCITLAARAAEKVSWIGDKKFIETADSFYDALAKGDARTAASHVYVKGDAKDGGLKLSFAYGRPFTRFGHGVPRLIALPGIHVDGLDAGSCHVVAFCVPPSPKLAEVKGLKSAYTSNWIQGDIRYDAWVKVEDEWKVIADWNADETIGSQKGSLVLTPDAAKAAEMNESAIAGEKEKETTLIDTLEEKIKQDSEK